jgi:hypothetical protein
MNVVRRSVILSVEKCAEASVNTKEVMAMTTMATGARVEAMNNDMLMIANDITPEEHVELAEATMTTKTEACVKTMSAETPTIERTTTSDFEM